MTHRVDPEESKQEESKQEEFYNDRDGRSSMKQEIKAVQSNLNIKYSFVKSNSGIAGKPNPVDSWTMRNGINHNVCSYCVQCMHPEFCNSCLMRNG